MSESNGRSLPLSSLNRPTFGQMSDHSPQNLQLSSMLGLASQGADVNSFSGFDVLSANEEQQQLIPKPSAFGSNAFVSSAASAKHYANPNSDLSTLNVPVFEPSISSRTHSDISSGTYFRPFVPSAKSYSSHNPASRALHRPLHSTDVSLEMSLQDFEDPASGREALLASDLERLSLRRAEQLTHSSRSNHRPTFSSQMPCDNSAARSSFRTLSDERLPSGQKPHIPDTSSEHGFQYHPAYHRSVSFGNRESLTSSISDSRWELQSPFYSTGSTPPVAPNALRANLGNDLSSRASSGQVTLLEKKLRGLQPYQTEQQFLQPNPLQMRSSFQQQFDAPYQSQVQMNPLARPYAMPSYSIYSHPQSTPSHQGRYSVTEQESSQVIRSAVLEDFRSNSKTNKRYELKVTSSPLAESG